MTLYNPSLCHDEGQYVVDQNRSAIQTFVDTFWDFLTVWLGESSLKLWVRIWLVFLLVGCMSPMAFLPHPFAITNVLGAFLLILVLNGREFVRIRGVNKNMGWPHVLAWTPVMAVNVLCLTTDLIDGERLTWENAGDNVYYKARYVAVIYNTVCEDTYV